MSIHLYITKRLYKIIAIVENCLSGSVDLKEVTRSSNRSVVSLSTSHLRIKKTSHSPHDPKWVAQNTHSQFLKTVPLFIGGRRRSLEGGIPHSLFPTLKHTTTYYKYRYGPAQLWSCS